ncbi:MAG: DUF3800 domain-containing protein [Proteobacteria bacterium]|nr:DUF3800 domain-containing protein [Pseudomonadota bacterium]
MRIIYMDEAGTSGSPTDPVAVIVGVIVHEKTQWVHARNLVRRVRFLVPAALRNNFIFHATDIWNSHELRESMSVAEREAVMDYMLSIPRAVGLSVAYGVVIKSRSMGAPNMPFNKTQQAHLVAFIGCVEAMEEFMAKIAFPGENARIIAEDVPDMRQTLLGSFAAVRQYGSPQVGTRVDYTQFHDPVESTLSGMMKVARIQRTNFASKHEEPLLQVADACAFALRRFFGGFSYGDKLVEKILGTRGTLKTMTQFKTPASNSVFFMVPPRLRRPDTPLPYIRTVVDE